MGLLWVVIAGVFLNGLPSFQATGLWRPILGCPWQPCECGPGAGDEASARGWCKLSLLSLWLGYCGEMSFLWSWVRNVGVHFSPSLGLWVPDGEEVSFLGDPWEKGLWAFLTKAELPRERRAIPGAGRTERVGLGVESLWRFAILL
ncbi:hypothetical protein MPNT_40102 [Candidatus Methylacidithermus pantelleriae]|uniref:Uncharacterized protein n=1 Tax=Candidatus Methylacidithermus pantelleriae TaxID=2744239 RepID=A0A8J2BKV2_9BACT|nr:hypothetical protein MPNT_40102 [Candidatus Methylacidithermus pantelleriae]